jgi:signal transduction histidine kinase
VLAVVAAVAAAAASAAYALGAGAPPDALIGPLAVSGSFVVIGLGAWARRPTNRTGRSMVLLGIQLPLIAFAGPPLLVLYPLGLAAFIGANVLLAYLILSFPSGRLTATWQRRLVIAVGFAIGVPRLIRLLFIDPAALGSDLVNPYLLFRGSPLGPAVAEAPYVIDAVVLVAMLAAVAWRWRTASGPARRVLLPVLAFSTVLLLTLLLDATAILAHAPAAVTDFLDTAQLAVRALIPIGFLVGLLRTRIARSAVADLVVDLGETPAPARLREALANALGDPSLTVAYWSSTGAGFVDATGAPAALPAEGSGHAVTVLERDGAPLAAIVHDDALLDDPGLVASVASAMRLAVENERLQAAVEEQLVEVRASRARIVAAGDAERRRVERDLHDGAQQRLVSLMLSLRLAQARLGHGADPSLRDSLDQASAEARAALVELRELARGIHPEILTQAGLGPAIQSLADRAPVEVTVDVGTERYSAAIEGAAYFVVSEALANIAKYARASRVVVRSTTQAGSLTLEVSDDGVGGADAAAGSGLRGLADRLSAVDGSLQVVSPPGGGTRLRAIIPITSAMGVAAT